MDWDSVGSDLRAVLLRVLGLPGTNLSFRDAVVSSRCCFIRDLDHVMRANGDARGRVLTAFEAIAGLTPESIARLDDKLAVGITRRNADIQSAIQLQRENFGISLRDVIKFDNRIPERALDGHSLMRDYRQLLPLTRISEALALKDFALGVEQRGGSDASLAIRFRELSRANESRQVLTPQAVLCLSEAAWVIATQSRLERWLNRSVVVTDGVARVPIGSFDARPFVEGGELARRARNYFGISENTPVRGLDHLITERLGVVVVQVQCAAKFAGAAIANNDSRGIALNLRADEGNVWFRRTTLAHELGHIMFDTTQDMKSLRVDRGEASVRDSRTFEDDVEARANAFAAEFLAPQKAVRALYENTKVGRDNVDNLCEFFGVGPVVIKRQLTNPSSSGLQFEKLTSSRGLRPSDEWKAEVSGTADYFSFDETPAVRTGKFAKLVAEAVDKHIISNQTAHEYLKLPDSVAIDNSFIGRLSSIQNLV